MTISQLHRILLVLLGVLSGGACARAEVPVGAGKFTFTNPLTEEAVEVYYVKDKDYDPADPPVFVYHGVRRNADEYRDGWLELAREHHLFVVVPLFSAETYPGVEGYNLGNLYVSETNLARKPEKTWSYHLPRVVFSYLRDHLKATTAEGYMAFGHSAGSQFLHRQMAFAPDPHLLLGVTANAGWYTFPDFTVAWPYGLKGTGFRREQLPPYLAGPMVVLLGDADTDPHHRHLRRSTEAMAQGKHRFERGHRFFAFSRDLAAEAGLEFGWRLETVPGVAHDNARMAPAAARLMVEEMNPRGRPKAAED